MVDPERSGAYKEAFLTANPAKGYAGLSILDLKNQRLGSTASYLLRREAVSKVLSVLNARRPFKKAIDLTLDITVKAGIIKAAVVVPFLTATDLDVGSDTSIQESLTKEQYMKLLQLRAQFYIE